MQFGFSIAQPNSGIPWKQRVSPGRCFDVNQTVRFGGSPSVLSAVPDNDLLRLNPQDVGKIIGRQGMTINPIRSLLLAGSAKKGLRCTLEIVEEKPAR